jgi:uncharacterized membrane protein (UPF0127 family)
MLLAFFAIIMLNQSQYNLETREVCFENNCFIAEICETPEQRTRGLMFRESMGAREGMLFVFDQETQHFFWMKNTLIPLDIIWINKDKRVVHIEKDVQPCITGEECVKIKSNEPAQYVLELIAGSAEKINLKIGDELYFSID